MPTLNFLSLSLFFSKTPTSFISLMTEKNSFVILIDSSDYLQVLKILGLEQTKERSPARAEQNKVYLFLSIKHFR